ncbi:MAG TPA: hypothetical protein H9875_06670 [Candidatus Levilactobacillus faecigallinarum]|uniref:Uncharacterized protein n=1 Tax=Candidatus Levilactobacillus faecigallinarum TaxID=2838638 RepID=A0A9D1U5C4_9LACO|nr:hypothetical protein [Candidatus Levilactobacillus faecigallinarum]
MLVSVFQLTYTKAEFRRPVHFAGLRNRAHYGAAVPAQRSEQQRPTQQASYDHRSQ